MAAVSAAPRNVVVAVVIWISLVAIACGSAAAAAAVASRRSLQQIEEKYAHVLGARRPNGRSGGSQSNRSEDGSLLAGGGKRPWCYRAEQADEAPVEDILGWKPQQLEKATDVFGPNAQYAFSQYFSNAETKAEAESLARSCYFPKSETETLIVVLSASRNLGIFQGNKWQTECGFDINLLGVTPLSSQNGCERFRMDNLVELFARESGGGGSDVTHAQLSKCIRQPFAERRICDLINPHCVISFDKAQVHQADVVLVEVDFFDWRRLKELSQAQESEADVLHSYLTMVRGQMKAGALLYRTVRDPATQYGGNHRPAQVIRLKPETQALFNAVIAPDFTLQFPSIVSPISPPMLPPNTLIGPFANLFVTGTAEPLPWHERTSGDVLLISSHCNFQSTIRNSVVARLMQHLHITSIGKCFSTTNGAGQIGQLVAERLGIQPANVSGSLIARYVQGFKFQLVIENGACRSFMTEKLTMPIVQGLVPLYLGAPNVHDFPFVIEDRPYGIFLDDFDSIDDFAQFVNAVSRDANLYGKFHEWRRAGAEQLSEEYALLFNRMRPPLDHERPAYSPDKGLSSVREHGKEAVIDFWGEESKADLKPAEGYWRQSLCQICLLKDRLAYIAARSNAKVEDLPLAAAPPIVPCRQQKEVAASLRVTSLVQCTCPCISKPCKRVQQPNYCHGRAREQPEWVRVFNRPIDDNCS